MPAPSPDRDVYNHPLVGVIMGSKSDWETMQQTSNMLETLAVPHECRIVSAHRTPDWMAEYAKTAVDRGIEIIIAAAGGAAHLPGMIAIAARRMGYRVHTLSPDEDTPTGQVADLEVNADYEDLDAVRKFARAVSVVTFEFENVPAATAAAAAECAPVRPAGQILHTT